jgi:WD40 repeat protein
MGEDRPLVVRDLFESAVTDIAWSPDGQHVVACSSDGTVVLIALGGEMGQAVERTETLQYLRGIYGEFPLPVGNQSMNMSISVAEIRENDAFFRTQRRDRPGSAFAYTLTR